MGLRHDFEIRGMAELLELAPNPHGPLRIVAGKGLEALLHELLRAIRLVPHDVRGDYTPASRLCRGLPPSFALSFPIWIQSG
jgi:hypothetical protein